MPSNGAHWCAAAIKLDLLRLLPLLTVPLQHLFKLHEWLLQMLLHLSKFTQAAGTCVCGARLGLVGDAVHEL